MTSDWNIHPTKLLTNHYAISIYLAFPDRVRAQSR